MSMPGEVPEVSIPNSLPSWVPESFNGFVAFERSARRRVFAELQDTLFGLTDLSLDKPGQAGYHKTFGPNTSDRNVVIYPTELFGTGKLYRVIVNDTDTTYDDRQTVIRDFLVPATWNGIAVTRTTLMMSRVDHSWKWDTITGPLIQERSDYVQIRSSQGYKPLTPDNSNRLLDALYRREISEELLGIIRYLGPNSFDNYFDVQL